MNIIIIIIIIIKIINSNNIIRVIKLKINIVEKKLKTKIDAKKYK